MAFCSEDILPSDSDFGKVDLEKLMQKEGKTEETGLKRSANDMGSNGVSAAMESLTTAESPSAPMETEDNQPTPGTNYKPFLVQSIYSSS